jgi:sugar (pentulose or hexulose) kinase
MRDERYGRFLELLAGARSRPSGIVVDPAWRGRTAPSPDPDARGMIRGLGMEHRLADLALATVEGIACQVRWMLEELEALSGRPIERVRLIGGGLENRHLVATKAAVGPWPFEASPSPETVAVGAAFVGAIAGGLLSVAEALAFVPPGEEIAVDRDLAAAYGHFYTDRFLPLVGGG